MKSIHDFLGIVKIRYQTFFNLTKQIENAAGPFQQIYIYVSFCYLQFCKTHRFSHHIRFHVRSDSYPFQMQASLESR